MIRLHKGLILALPILLATPAIAQHTEVTWLSGNGQPCSAVCTNRGYLAVDSGVYTRTSNPNYDARYYVCRTSAQQEGTRPGYNLQTDPLVLASKCTVGWGNKEEASPTYDCLCAPCKDGPARCPY
jgi:hypothetical protein